MKKIWWLASYPKSGNTWLRAFLTSYLETKPLDINSLNAISLTSRKDFDDWLGLESSDLKVEEIMMYRHYYHLEFASNLKESLFVKTHDLNMLTCENKKLIPEETTQGIIYLVRNPLDVALSYAYHENCSIDEMIKKMNNKESYLLSFQTQLRLNLPQKLSSWNEHVKSWINEKNIKVIKYEDLIEKPNETFKAILLFMGYEVDKQKLEYAIKESSFNNLKNQEKKEGFREKYVKANSFFRVGKSGEGKKKLDKKQIKNIIDENFEMMEYLGYTKGLNSE